eukprot:312886-Amphidinium_carterae.1
MKLVGFREAPLHKGRLPIGAACTSVFVCINAQSPRVRTMRALQPTSQTSTGCLLVAEWHSSSNFGLGLHIRRLTRRPGVACLTEKTQMDEGLLQVQQ